MCELSKRELEFIQLMLEEEEYKPILYFSKKLRVSDKTLKDDLKEIRTYLGTFGVEIFGKTGKGILINQTTKNNVQILNNLTSARRESHHDSSEVRRATILKNMLIDSNRTTSIHKLSQQYYVSNASIVNDMKYIGQWLEKFNLFLEKNIDGTRIKGSEKNIRKAIASLIQEFRGKSSDNNKRIEFNEIIRLEDTTLNALLELFDLEEIMFIETLLENMEYENRNNICDVYYVNLLTHILICIKRVRDGIHVENIKVDNMISVDTLRKYEQAEKIAVMINEKYQISIGEEEIYYIYQYLVSSGLDNIIDNDEKREQDDSFSIAMIMTEYFSNILEINFKKEKHLLNGLILHIRPMLNRLEYNIEIRNPFTKEVEEKYPQILGICKIVLANLSRKFNLKNIINDEIAAIAIYYQTMILKLTSPKKVLIVCHSGFGTSQLLAAKLRNEFSTLNIVDVVSLRKVEAMNLEDIEYIISTVPVNVKEIPHVVISVLLPEKDIQNIRNNIYFTKNKEKDLYYMNFLNKQISAIEINVNEMEKTGNDLEKICICEVELVKGLFVHIGEPSDEEIIISIEVQNQIRGKEYVKITVLVKDQNRLMKVLAELYKLATRTEDMEQLLFCKTKDDVYKFLKQRQPI